MKNQWVARSRFLSAFVLALCLGGCAVAPPAALTPEGTKMAVNSGLIQQLRTTPVDPEKKTNSASEVAELLLAVTLEATLANFDYLQPIKARPAHGVAGKVEKLEMPIFGMTFTIPLSVRYSIRSSAGGALIYDKVIDSQGSATAGDSFIGAKRSNMALQRAIQNNIDLFMKELAALPIQPGVKP